MKRSLRYAYPSSDNAKRLGHALSGCWLVVVTDDGTVRHESVYSYRNDALRHYDSLGDLDVDHFHCLRKRIRSAMERFEVYSVQSYRDYPNVTPAGRYETLLEAICHADKVTYRMAVVDSQNEAAGFVYCNYPTEGGGKCKCQTGSTVCDWCQQHRCPDCGDMLDDCRCNYNYRNGQILSQFV